jgi:hypothetical protein
MLSYESSPGCPHFERTLAPFLTEEGLPFAQVLSAADVAQAFADEGVTFGTLAHAVLTPALTLWALLSQVVDDAKEGLGTSLIVVRGKWGGNVKAEQTAIDRCIRRTGMYE